MNDNFSILQIFRPLLVVILGFLLQACDIEAELYVDQPAFGFGVISSSDGYIDCGESCYWLYDDPGDLTTDEYINIEFTATASTIPDPDTGNVPIFLNWTGVCNNPANATQPVCHHELFEGPQYLGAEFSDPSTPGIGSATKEVVAGSTISVRYTGSTSLEDSMAIYYYDPESELVGDEVLISNRATLTDAEGWGEISIRVPTIAGNYILQMLNKFDQVILVDNQLLEVQDYDATLTLGHSPVLPTDRVDIAYSGATHPTDAIAFFEAGASTNDNPLSNPIAIQPGEGIQSIVAPDFPGNYELRMINNFTERPTNAEGSEVTRSNSIVVEENIDITYDGLASITPLPLISENFYYSTTETLLVEYTGAGENTDQLKLYQQEASASFEAEFAEEATLASPAPHQLSFDNPNIPGIYDIRLENSAGYVIKDEDLIVLNPAISAIYASPEITQINDTIAIAFSGASFSDQVVLLKQNETDPSTNYLVRKDVSEATTVGGEGHTQLIMPNEPGMYELHLLTSAYGSTGTTPLFVTVIDPDINGIYAPLKQIQNDDVRIVYHRSGEVEVVEDYLYYFAEQETSCDNFVAGTSQNINSLSGHFFARVPIVEGQYVLRIDDGTSCNLSSDIILIASTNPTVNVIEDGPVPLGAPLQIEYAASIQPTDRITFCENPDCASIKLQVQVEGSSGIINIDAPYTVGEYHVCMLNDDWQIITPECDTITVFDDHDTSLVVTNAGGECDSSATNPPSIFDPGIALSVCYFGSDDVLDFIFLRPLSSEDEVVPDYSFVSGARETQGIVDISANYFLNTGIYALEIGGASTTDTNTYYQAPIIILDDQVTEIFVAPLTARINNGTNEPSDVSKITLAFSLAEDVLATTSDASGYVGIYEQEAMGILLGVTEPVVTHRIQLTPQLQAVQIDTPSEGGVYVVRMMSDSDEILTEQRYLKVIDASKAEVHYPNNVIAGETHWAVLSRLLEGDESEGDLDRLLLVHDDDFVPGVTTAESLEYLQLGMTITPGSSNVDELRSPTTFGIYDLVNTKNHYESIVAWTQVQVHDYINVSLTLSNGDDLPTTLIPGEDIEVKYSGSTGVQDRLGFFDPATHDLDDIVQMELLGDGVGIETLTAPYVEGIYQYKMISSDSVLIGAFATVLVEYGLDPDTNPYIEFESLDDKLSQPGEDINVIYHDSTKYDDQLDLYDTNFLDRNSLKSALLGDDTGTVTFTAPDSTGVYEIEMTNRGGVPMPSGSIYTSVLDPNKLDFNGDPLAEVFVGPRLAGGGDEITIAYSLPGATWTGGTTLEIFNTCQSSGYGSIPIADDLEDINQLVLASPDESGVYDVRIRNAMNDIVATTALYVVAGATAPTVYGPRCVIAGETHPVTYEAITTPGSAFSAAKIHIYKVLEDERESNPVSETNVNPDFDEIDMPVEPGTYDVVLFSYYDSIELNSYRMIVFDYDADIIIQ